MEDNFLEVEDNLLGLEDNLLGIEDNLLGVENNFLISPEEDQDNEVSVTPKTVSEPGTVIGLLAVTVLGLGLRSVK
ncbi:PEP-CTERM sorting domain-containing protein [Crocosphaera chwakensis]|uniref:Uncharacterized protein n=1 Tax=Crocosphaera chwakensis CCY0110 TaxID=391612 RepID=A3IYH3_9CHRO|nr:PEP-CTERM sorting domain-containing protein [Crocosphaera chwakensis]EAZ88463.1 hypothetical protein CY0110_26909 [Crocosphaera chwakensis CCY0110]